MIVSKEEIMNLFESAYDRDEQASEIKKDIKEDFKTYAENNEMNAKSIGQAYSLYKKYKKGSVDMSDDTYFELTTVVEEYFAGQQE